MPRYKRSERDQALSETRLVILQAATAEFAQEGYVGANIDRIAKAAGYAKGTLYNHFDSKQALMLALIEQIAGSHVDFVVQRVRQEDDPQRRLEKFFEAGFDFVATFYAQAQVMINSLYGPHAEFKQVMYQAYLPMFALLGQEIIVPGIEKGQFRPVDPVSTAGLMMNIYLGIASQTNEQGQVWQDAAQVTDFVWHALRP